MNSRLYSLLLLAATSLTALSQAKTVNDAEKLIGIDGKIKEARQLINQALQDSTTQNEARTWVVAANIETEYFKNEYHKLTINPNDSRVDKIAMSKALLDAYQYYMKALPLDTIVTKKGKIKTKYSKEIQKNLKNLYLQRHFLWAASIYSLQNNHYPEAYNLFTIQGELPKHNLFNKDKELKSIPDSICGSSLYNAAISAWQGGKHLVAAKTFHKARLHSFVTKEVFSYEIACYQQVAQQDSINIAMAQNAMIQTAKEGYETFGNKDPLFLHIYIRGLSADSDFKTAIKILNKEISADPQNGILYRHRAYVYDKFEDDDASVADYIKAGELSSDFETLIEASKKIALVGNKKINEINKKIQSDSTKTEKQEIIEKYFNYALSFASKAKEISPDDFNANLLIENITYDIKSNSL